jgi:hypothetical protein
VPADVVALEREGVLIVDACRRELRRGDVTVTLASRPVLFALAVTLAEAVPEEQSRSVLVERAFGARRVSDSLRVRLRVELGRLRRALEPLGAMAIEPTSAGFRLRLSRQRSGIAVLLPPADGETSLLLALLRGGEAWSSSALSSASRLGQRAVQRALGELKALGKIDSHGAGRHRRWVARPPEGFATTLLLLMRPTSR